MSRSEYSHRARLLIEQKNQGLWKGMREVIGRQKTTGGKIMVVCDICSKECDNLNLYLLDDGVSE